MKQGVANRLFLIACLATALVLATVSSAPAAHSGSLSLTRDGGSGAETSQTITELAYVGTDVINRVSSTVQPGPDGTPHLFTRDIVPIATAPPCFHHLNDQNSSVCPLAGVSQASFSLNGGGDSLVAKISLPVIASGGAGADDLVTGEAKDVLRGGPGADRLTGGAGIDVLKGQAGTDRLFGGGAKDRCFGGAGHKDRATGCEKRRAIP